MKLDFSSLEKALASLLKALERSGLAPADEELRDAVIQRFEYSYELSWKMLKRQLEQEVPSPSQIDELSFRDLLREANERGIRVSFERWIDYRSKRNLTAHVYDPAKAKIVYDCIQAFYEDAKSLLDDLKNRS